MITKWHKQHEFPFGRTGEPTNELVELYRKWATGGAGLIITGCLGGIEMCLPVFQLLSYKQAKAR